MAGELDSFRYIVDEVCRLILDPSTEIMAGIIYTTEYWIVNNTECDAALWMNSVWWLSFTMDYIYTLSSLSVCVKRGYIGQSMVPGS